MHSREQDLAALREEYLRGNKKQKKKLLNEAKKRTKLNRKVLIRKLSQIPAAVERKRQREQDRIDAATREAEALEAAQSETNGAATEVVEEPAAPEAAAEG